MCHLLNSHFQSSNLMLSPFKLNSQEIKPQFKPTRPVRLRDDYSFSYNPKCLNKPKPNDKNVDFTSYYSLSGSRDDIKGIVNKGQAISGSVFQKSYRKKENVIKTDLIIADIDDGLSLEGALENDFIKQYGDVYTTPSHGLKGDRFRVIFFSPVSLTIAEYETILSLINERFLGGVIDANAMECGRGFYGNSKAQWFNTNPHELPFELVIEARKIIEQKEKEREERRKERIENQEAVDISANELEKAYFSIPIDVREKYKVWIEFGMATYHHFKGSDDGFNLWNRWSSECSNYDGENSLYRKWQSFSNCTGEPITIKTVFYYAIEHGYKPPIREGKDFKGFSKEAYILWKKRQYEKLTKFTPDHTFNERFVLDEVLKLDLINHLTGFKSAKYTGKSYALSALVRKIKTPILIIGNRRLLTNNLATDLKNDGIAVTYVDDEYKPELIASLVINGENLSIVVDSMAKLSGLDLSDYFIIIDESEQVLDTIAVSKTHIDKVRGKVWGVLSAIASQCQGILLLDADLSDRTVDYWGTLAPHLTTQKTENDYRLEREAVIYPVGKDGYVSILTDIHKALREGQNIVIVCDSESKLSELHQLFHTQYKTALITAPNIADNPSITRFFENKGEAIAEEKIQLTLISPVGQSGLSLELDDYFDFGGVYGLFYGNIQTNIARQILIRVRSECSRYIWSNNKGLNYQNRFNWCEILKTESETNDYVKETIEYYQNVEKLSSPEALRKVAQLIEDNQLIQDVNNQNIAKCKALTNLNKSMFRELLIEELNHEGYGCLLKEENNFSDIANQLKDIGETLKENEATRAFNAPSIIGNEKRIEELKRKPSLNESERAEFLRYQIEKILPNFDALTVPFILEYIIKDRFKTINGVQNYFLVNNPEIAKNLDFNSFSYALSQCREGGVFYLSSKKYSLLVDVWQGLNLSSLLKETFTSETAKNTLDNVTPRLRSILRSLGIRWSKDSHHITVLGKIYQLFGFKTKKLKTINGLRYYSIIPIELIKDENNWIGIFNSIASRYAEPIPLETSIYSELESSAVVTSINNQNDRTALNSNVDGISDVSPSNEPAEKEDLNSLNTPPPPPTKNTFIVGQLLTIDGIKAKILDIFPLTLKVLTEFGEIFVNKSELLGGS